MQLSTGKPAVETSTAHVLVIIGIVLLALLTVYRSFGEFGFYYDDWRFLQEAVQAGTVETVFPTRPLHRPLTEWVFNTVSFNPTTGYILLATLLIASALAMYWVMSTVFPRRRALAVIATIVYLLYPGDLSRTWITAGLTANRPAVLLALVSLGLLFSGLRLRKQHFRWFQALFAASLSVYIVSLMLYEAQATLVPALAFSGAVWIGASGRGLAHRSAARNTVVDAIKLSAPFAAVLVGVILWRVVLVQTGTDDRFSATANFSPLYLARQLVGVYYFNYLEQPVEVIVEAVPFLGRMSIAALMVAFVGAALITVPVVYFGRRLGGAQSVTRSPSELAVNPEIRFYWNLLLASLVLTGVVYVVLLPHDHIISASGLQGPYVSRLNAAAAVVVAIAGAAAVMLAWTWSITRWRSRRTRINLAAAGVMAAGIVLLVSFHGIVQRDYADAWQLQRRYTQQVFEALPEVAPNAHLHFSGVPSQHGSSYLFMYSLEHMLQLVYDDTTITVTSSPSTDSKSVLNQNGLYLNGSFIASADRVWHFTLVPEGCNGKLKPDCGALVMSAPYGLGGSGNSQLSVAASTNHSRTAVWELLGITMPDSDGLDDGRVSPSQFAAPSDPPSDQTGD